MNGARKIEPMIRRDLSKVSNGSDDPFDTTRKLMITNPLVEARGKPCFFCCIAAPVSCLRLRQFHRHISNKG